MKDSFFIVSFKKYPSAARRKESHMKTTKHDSLLDPHQPPFRNPFCVKSRLT